MKSFTAEIPKGDKIKSHTCVIFDQKFGLMQKGKESSDAKKGEQFRNRLLNYEIRKMSFKLTRLFAFKAKIVEVVLT